MAAVELVLKHIGHRHQFEGTAGIREGISHGPGAASAASDQGELDRAGSGRVHVGEGDTGQRRHRCELSGRLEEFTS